MEASTKGRRLRRLVASSCALGGIVPYLLCATEHYCIGGHLQHPPYS
jgi:hypothetical protein